MCTIKGIVKRRINLGQDFVIGGYVPSRLGVDSAP
jgi:hypothetical protein